MTLLKQTTVNFDKQNHKYDIIKTDDGESVLSRSSSAGALSVLHNHDWRVRVTLALPKPFTYIVWAIGSILLTVRWAHERVHQNTDETHRWFLSNLLLYCSVRGRCAYLCGEVDGEISFTVEPIFIPSDCDPQKDRTLTTENRFFTACRTPVKTFLELFQSQ